jgi:hypothetical protein
MKRLMSIVMAVLYVCLFSTVLWANNYDFPDRTYVQAYQKTSPSNYYGTGDNQWRDVIGDNIYQTFGVNIRNDIFSIFTNFPDAGDSSSSVPVADLFFISTDLFGVKMSGNNTGSFYRVGNQFKTSIDLYSGSNLIYGGKMSDEIGGPGEYIPVKIGNYLDLLAKTTVVWNLIGSDPKYRIDIVLNDDMMSFIGNDFTFIWGTGMCGNDTIRDTAAVVPIPGSLLLLSAGLSRMFIAIRKRLGRP